MVDADGRIRLRANALRVGDVVQALGELRPVTSLRFVRRSVHVHVEGLSDHFELPTHAEVVIFERN